MVHESRKTAKTGLARLARPVAGFLLASTILMPAQGVAQDAGLSASAADALSAATTAGTSGAPIDDADTDAGYGTSSPSQGVANTGLITQNPVDTSLPEGDPGRILEETGRENLPENTVDGLRPSGGFSDEPPGIRFGTFVLKPALSQGISYESTKTGSSTESRGFAQTGLNGTLTSDWSRHQLSVVGEGRYERNLWGEGETEPEANVDADLRLDLADDVVGHLTAGYSLEREDSTDPNAIADAQVQSAVQDFSVGASLERDFGLLRGRIGAEVTREIYGDATLADGSSLSLSDRDNTAGTVTARLGYEISPALIPFIEASVGRTVNDDKHDSLGYERSSWTTGGRTGMEVDLGEKLRGELALGYARAAYDDSRLQALDAFTLDGLVNWSPQRGTDVALGFETKIEPSTVAGESGYISYSANTDIAHELRDNLVARLAADYTLRDFPSSGTPNQNVYLAGVGLTWGISRYVDLTGDVSYELTTQRSTPDTGVTRAGVGLTLKR
ncbi:outer membrane beta-barrel protein [Sinorhizobium sp. BG8]|uniref:outer membrane beta-barrel protein n=1 Tax=Sinorhizobium sp. BG8 TaxID=2613773 RepID=UPI00193CA77E|nr:outer membrane beta-barrel protein [Sinorhizobium sp. BG8]QRM56664.1 outer membrane beta-barrel protein [Sinorhizobium sp. BG8]